MMRTRHAAGLAAALLLLIAANASAAQPTSSVDAEVLFATRVLPTLQAKCFACHGDDAKKLKGGFDLTARARLLQGGDSEKPGIVPGKPGDSPLYRAVLRNDSDFAAMPPKESDKLSAADVEAIKRWIEGGAPWPSAKRVAEIIRAQKPAGITVKTSGGLSPEWTNRPYQPDDLWAYKPLRQPAAPDARGNPIDAFLRAKLKAAGVEPAGPADRVTLIRRVTFDLTGLPPTTEEIEAFAADKAPDSYAKVVDRLLASPRYAEQQARHWLDVARYADTAGFSNDFERPSAWRYRDYVVRAFHHDKPYDRFVLEQLAGDELAPDDPEALIATGFLRMGPWEHTGMTVAAITRQQWLDDVTHAVGVTFLGQGLRCAACHDHKFDPVPTRDYYRIQAGFATTYFAERPLRFLPFENLDGAAAARELVNQRLKEVAENQAALQRKAGKALEAFLRERGVKRLEDLPPDQRPKRDYLGAAHGLDKVDLTLRKVYSKSKQYFERELLRYEPYALTVYTGPDNGYMSPRALNPLPGPKKSRPADTFILLGGSLEAPGEKVSPGILSAVALVASPSADTTLPSEPAGRRLALARWIVGAGRSLAARVIVNRIWQQHFGTGLVATPNNFGKMGARPSHPELLDWLASNFIEQGWSVKKLHRLIVASEVYRQSGTHPDIEKLKTVDPKNQWLAYFPSRRLAAEEIRDAMLFASGDLNLQAGGPGFFPEINWEVALQPRHVMGSVAPAYVPSLTPRERHRRTLYAMRIRTLADPMLEVFNRPGSDTSCERRDETTVASQAFALFNGAFAHQRALALADRVMRDGHQDTRLDAVFRRVLGRAPNADERRWSQEHVAGMERRHAEHAPAKTSLPTKVRREFIEELVGELVTWDEELTPLRRYQPDVQAWQLTAETRALAELALVLMNTNEFLSVR
ncbi:MAG: PSD1 and planctomycete cytochrome C domain-containing protein [Gemmataceae bacterium]|nr:PSD1 and planctomycete cytochrome C domain-containing protein [Gemmataceae bacterium]